MEKKVRDKRIRELQATVRFSRHWSSGEVPIKSLMLSTRSPHSHLCQSEKKKRHYASRLRDLLDGRVSLFRSITRARRVGMLGGYMVQLWPIPPPLNPSSEVGTEAGEERTRK